MADKEPVFKLVPLSCILPSRHQPRTVFGEEGIGLLSQSIKKNGIESPFKVREVPVPNPLPEGVAPFEDKCYEQLYGGRRFIAAKKAGVEKVWVIVVKVDNEKEAAMSSYTENTMREELPPLDEAAFFKHLKDLDPDLTSEQLAIDTNNSAGYVSQSLSFNEFSGPVKEKFRRLNFSRSHILELIRLPSDELKLKAAEEISARGLSVQSTRQLVDKMIGKPEQAGQPHRQASKGMGDGVHTAKSGKKIHIEYNGPADTPADTIAKAIIEEHQKWQAEQNKPKPDPKARKAQIAQVNQFNKQMAALAKGDYLGYVTAQQPELWVPEIKRIIPILIQGLSDPKLTEEQRANNNLQIQKLQAKLNELQKNQAPSGVGNEAGENKQSDSGGSYSVKLPIPKELSSKCEAEIAGLEKKYAEAQTPEEKAAQKAALMQARINYNNLRKDFDAPPIDYPDIP